MVKAIIFDMDGVLFDTETFYFQRRIDFLATNTETKPKIDDIIES